MNPPLRNLHLYGDLAKRYGKTHRVAARTLPEALRIVECNHRGFLLRVRRGSFHCLHGDRTLKRSTEMYPHHLTLPREQGDFHLVPQALGAGGRTGKIIFSIVIGGALLATGIGGAVGGAFASSLAGGAGTLGAGFATSSAILGLSHGTLALMGAAFFLGGINMLLTPTPKTNTESQKPTAFTFGGPGNTSDEGGPVPLVYGEVITGGVTIASGIRNGYGSTSDGGGSGSGGAGIGYGGGSISFDEHYHIH